MNEKPVLLAAATRDASQAYAEQSRRIRLAIEQTLSHAFVRDYPSLSSAISMLLTVAAASSAQQDVPHQGRFFVQSEANDLAAALVAYCSGEKLDVPRLRATTKAVMLNTMANGKKWSDADHEKVCQLLIGAVDFLVSSNEQKWMRLVLDGALTLKLHFTPKRGPLMGLLTLFVPRRFVA